jgi:mannose-6-phosphate isomerase
VSESLYPLTFQPIFKERVWGGRNLEVLYHKPLPPGPPIGESWEITDRPEGISVIANGPLAGRTLRWLMEHHRREVLGPNAAETGAFPLLVKILDAAQTLSVQVHPPASVASSLHGEPKTEIWYVAQATPEAALYVGLRKGITRPEFEAHIKAGTVAECLHRVPVSGGDVMFLPSGRLHAIGAGNVIFEIQQNSDTTYRVFDWNRTGLDGKPRALHIAESLASINFEDIEPRLIASIYSRNLTFKVRYLIDDPLFRIDLCLVNRRKQFHFRSDAVQILGVVKGRLRLTHPAGDLVLEAGQFGLLPASLGRVSVTVERQAEFLHVQPG